MDSSEESSGTDSGTVRQSRREWLAGVGLAALSMALSGCSGNEETENGTPSETTGNSTDQPDTEPDNTADPQNPSQPALIDRLYASPGEIQEMIDSRAVDDSYGHNIRSQVKLDPTAVYSSDTEDLPIVLRRGVTRDMNGADLAVLEDTDAFHFRPESQLRNGRVKYLPAGDRYSSTIFDIDTTRFARTANIANNIRIQNVDTKGWTGNAGTVMYIDATGSPVAGLQVNSCLWHNCGDHGIYVRNENPDSWANANWWSDMMLYGGKTIIEFDSVDAAINGNYFSGLPHPNAAHSEWLAQIHGDDVASNKFEVMAWDPHRFSEGLVRLSGRAKRNVFKNTMNLDIANLSWVDNKKWVDKTEEKDNAWCDELHGRIY
jgi:hypothetical protein